MNAFTVDVVGLMTVAAAVLDVDGVLIAANAGFLRLLPSGGVGAVGSRVGRHFIQPTFAALVASAGEEDGAEGSGGLLTLGAHEDKTRTLRGRVWRSAAGIHLVAEYDIEELEALNDAMLRLNRESAFAQSSLARENLTLARREAESMEASLTDALTGVGNRRKLEQVLAVEVGRARRHGGALSAIVADVDHFKRVNDDFGHGAGDKVLVRVAARLVAASRASDFVARFGGEEFVIVMPATTRDQACAKAERMRSELAAERIEPLPGAVTASFGVAQLGDGEDGASLLERADAALYQAKEGGRDRVVAAA